MFAIHAVEKTVGRSTTVGEQPVGALRLGGARRGQRGALVAFTLEFAALNLVLQAPVVVQHWGLP